MSKSNVNLLVFCNGWGMDERIVSHLSTADFDFVHFNDYSNLQNLSIDHFADYKTKTLIAWSFGVLMAAYHLSKYNFDTAIAVNGTIQPIDRKFGIAPEIFAATLANLDQPNILKFYQRCCLTPEILTAFLQNKPDRDLESLKAELEFFNTISHSNNNLDNIFKVAVIGTRDRIFLPDNQRNYWQNKAAITEAALPHYPFYGFKSWKEFISAATSQ